MSSPADQGSTALFFSPDAPLGDTLWPAAAASGLFLAMALAALVQWRDTRFGLYRTAFLSLAMRGAAMAIRGSTVSSGSSSLSLTITYMVLLGSGFGIALSIQTRMLVGWLGNTADHRRPASWKALRWLLHPFVLLGVVAGPVLSTVSALLFSINPEDEAATNAGLKVREATTCMLVATAGVATLASIGLSAYSVRQTGLDFSWTRHPHQLVACVVPGSVLLLVSAIFRLVYVMPSLAPSAYSNELLFYLLQVLPELLDGALIAVPPCLLARVHLSSGFNAWWAEKHAETGLEPVGGMHLDQTPAGPGNAGRLAMIKLGITEQTPVQVLAANMV